jgi:hypothetical protein
MLAFVLNSWNWVSTQEWWQRGIIGALIGAVLLILIPAAIAYASNNKILGGIGGDGGGGTIAGGGGTIVGGRGGSGGSPDSGRGGKGGSGSISGGNGLIIGGDGGNAGGWDGRGGKPTRSPGEVAGMATEMWKYGRGGGGANAPEYNRRLAVLASVRSEYVSAFPDTAPFIEAGVDTVPATWVNKRLEELGEGWRVTLTDGGYSMPPLPK